MSDQNETTTEATETAIGFTETADATSETAQQSQVETSAEDTDTAAAEIATEAETTAETVEVTNEETVEQSSDESNNDETPVQQAEPEAVPEATPEVEAAPEAQAESEPEPEAQAEAEVEVEPEHTGPTLADGTPIADPLEGLGLSEDTTPLGPPNMGGYESGEILSGKVQTVTKKEAEVDLGNGQIGVISDRHWASNTSVDLTTVVKIGDDVEAAVLARADHKKRITLSRLWAQQKRGWETVESAAKTKADVEATITEAVRGGLSLDVNGIRGFMPGSLADVVELSDLTPLVGQQVKVRVIEADRTKARLIVSRKAAMRANERAKAKEALADFKVDQEFTGTVAQITDFGAFVDIDGVRGLVHKSEIGWGRDRDPQRSLTVGQEVKVRVVKVQPSRNRLGLSMRSGNDPLREIHKGDRFEATVVRLVDFGAFCALPNGLEGLVHVSEMAEYRVFAPEEIVIPGEKVWVKVLKVDRKRRKLDLSMAQAVVPDPAAEQAEYEAAKQKADSEDDSAAEGAQDQTVTSEEE